jgi:tetratricopeptide (TPR) repeat protein
MQDERKRFDALLSDARGITLDTLEQPLDLLANAHELRALGERLDEGGGVAIGHKLASIANYNLAALESSVNDAERALECFTALDDPFGVGATLVHLGRVWLRTPHLARSRACFERALSVLDATTENSIRGGARLGLAWVDTVVCDFKSAAHHLRAAQAIYEELSDDRGLADCQELSALTSAQLGDYTLAAQAYELSLASFRACGDTTGVARVMSKFGLALAELGAFGRALELTEEALGIAESLGRRSLLCGRLGHCGSVYHDLGEWNRAADCFIRAAAIAREIGDSDAEAGWTAALARLRSEEGSHSESVELFRTALGAFKSLGDHHRTCEFLIDLGLQYRRDGDIAEALSTFEELVASAEEHGFKQNLASGWSYIGSILTDPEYGCLDSGRGSELLRNALDVQRSLSLKRSESKTHSYLAVHYLHQKCWELACLHLQSHQVLEAELHAEQTRRQLHARDYLRIKELEQQRQRQRTEAEAARLRVEALEREVEFKQRQLASTALSLAKQTELLAAFRNEIRSIIRGNSDLIEVIKHINRKLAELPCDAIDWTRFDAEFQQTYPQFQSALHAQHPELTKMELKICSLLRLNLTSQEIAQLMCKSERSVEWHRLNIRRKLGLTRNQDVTTTLAAIG